MCAMVIPGIAGEFYGSVGNVTFSKVKSGFNIAKKKPYPFKTKTAKRRKIRDNVAQADHNWIAVLTEGNKTDWEDAAANFAQTRHGVAYSISGHNLYVGHFIYMVLAEQTPIAAPTIFTGRAANIGATFSWNGATHKVTLTLDRVPTGNEFIIIFFTDADRPDATYRRIPYRTRTFSAEAGGDTFDLDAEYRAQDGTLHIRWLLLDKRGSFSSANVEHYSYTYS